ncbi:MAG TPA: GH25 family lysozyme [Thermoanaerobaculia bacterium]|nr:GH25 family lysozyme [Thermoanaerobaculia bacterium]
MADGQVPGIDVSHYQGTVDWQQVAGAGMAYAFVKATQGVSTVDSQFAVNWPGVQAAGLLRGAYHFYQPGDDPQQQAENFLSVVQLEPGDLLPVLDIETLGSQTASEIVQGIETWLGTVQAAIGRAPIVYTAPGFWNGLGTQQFGTYPLWVAEYGVSIPKLPAGWTSWTFWQYSESGSVAGVSGSVDLDVFQGSPEALRQLTL